MLHCICTLTVFLVCSCCIFLLVTAVQQPANFNSLSFFFPELEVCWVTFWCLERCRKKMIATFSADHRRVHMCTCQKLRTILTTRQYITFTLCVYNLAVMSADGGGFNSLVLASLDILSSVERPTRRHHQHNCWLWSL